MAAAPHAFPAGFDELLICPINQVIMQDPVIACDGHTYERRAIQLWFASHAASPLTGVEFSVEARSVFQRNIPIQQVIAAYIQARDNPPIMRPDAPHDIPPPAGGLRAEDLAGLVVGIAVSAMIGGSGAVRGVIRSASGHGVIAQGAVRGLVGAAASIVGLAAHETTMGVLTGKTRSDISDAVTAGTPRAALAGGIMGIIAGAASTAPPEAASAASGAVTATVSEVPAAVSMPDPLEDGAGAEFESIPIARRGMAASAEDLAAIREQLRQQREEGQAKEIASVPEDAPMDLSQFAFYRRPETQLQLAEIRRKMQEHAPS